MKVLNWVSGSWISVIHGLASAFLLFVHRSLFWNINVLFDGPLWITFAECMFTVVVCLIRLRSSSFSIIRSLRQGFFSAAKEHSLNIKLSLAFSLMIICNNLCLYYMDMPMYFVARSLAVPISLVFTYRSRSVNKCVGILLGALLVVVGYIVTLIEENLTNLLIAEGIVFGILASLFVVIYYQEASHLASGNNYDVHLKQIYVNNIICSLFTFIAIAFTETSELMFLPYSLYPETVLFWLLIVLSCITSSFVGTVVLREVTTYSMSHRELIGLVRSLLQTVLAVIIFRVYTTGFWWVGVLLTAAGTALYWRAYMIHVTDPLGTNSGAKDGLPTVNNLTD
ncbi:GDP fucose transporter [Echinococcus multilocularis]|uniref:GDP fucose transporter n=1 Tax=Echinococcus multilocularis TaxID=6211 RepID=A0A068YDB1_ECHMU|nr:GDP fucose transporter [Echinococcus multilocularis]